MGSALGGFHVATSSSSPYASAWMARVRTPLTRDPAVKVPEPLDGVFHQ